MVLIQNIGSNLIQFTKIISFKNIFEIIKEIDYFGIPLLAIHHSKNQFFHF